MHEVNFKVQGARLWFPFSGSTVSVQLMSDLDGSPGNVLATQTGDVLDHQVDLYFDSPHIAEKVWLMVDYTTNMGNRFVAASIGGGENSYYMNQVGDIQYISSMANAGFNCELLFGVLGDFVGDEVDLQLSSFDLAGELLPAGSVYPSFSIYNHSDTTISSAQLRLILSRPGFAQYDTLDIDIADALAPREQYEFDGSDTGEYALTLPDEPTQLRVEAILSSEFAEHDTLFANNSKTIYYQVFADESPLQLVENFLRQDQSGVINGIQQALLPAQAHALQYYPILSDSLANISSRQRFNWYGFNSIPRTVVAGTEQIIGFTDQYQDSFVQAIATLEGKRSFVSDSSCSLTALENTENVNVRIQLFNEHTHLYTQTTQSLMMGSRFFTGLFQKLAGEENEYYVLRRWIAFADTINTAFDQGASLEKNYTFTINDLSESELEQEYRLYYWVQGNGNRQIYYADFSDFYPASYTPNADFVTPRLDLRLYPNPLRVDQTLKIEGDGKAKLSIYNLRGQRIYKNDSFKRELNLENALFPAAGIYFIRIEQEGQVATTKKISIIK